MQVVSLSLGEFWQGGTVRPRRLHVGGGVPIPCVFPGRCRPWMQHYDGEGNGRMSRRLAATVLLVVLVAGCARDTNTAYQRDGVAYGVTEGVFRGRWWSYYERGSSFLSGQFLEEAAADFERALALRGGDTWRARTYGLHFVEYFPNRELGIALFQMGRLEEAEACLQRSLEQMDTDRGHFFLDQVTRAKLAQGTVQDTDAPAVGTSVTSGMILASRELSLEIDAADDVGVAEVTVNGAALPQRGSAEEVRLKQDLLLTEGTHAIEVAAKDLADKEQTTTVEVVVDLTGPTIGIFSPIEPAVTASGEIMLEGATVDKNGVATVSLGDRELAQGNGQKRVNFDTTLPLGAGENTFILAARDVAGNETRSAVKVFKGDPDSAEAKLWLLKQKFPERLKLAALPGVTLDMLLAQPAEAASEIRVKSPSPDRPYRHNRTLCVSGEVVTQTKVASLTINGEPFEDLTGAPKESFNRRIPIDDGAGQLEVNIQATDDAGAALEQDFFVEVRPVELDTPESRMAMAVLSFAGQQVDGSVSDALRVNAEQAIAGLDRFRVLDRMQLEQVLTEQQLSELASPDSAIALGKVVNAQAFIVADVFPHDQAGLEVKARVIDTETTDLVSIADVFIEDRNDLEGVKQGCAKLAAQLNDLYPRLSGELRSDSRARGGAEEFLVNWGKADGVRPGMYMLVIQEDPWVDEDTGEVLEMDYLTVGRARIMSVTESSAKARSVEINEEGVKLEQGMPAITM